MSDTRDWLVQWLRDAHAMEEQAKTMLNGLIGRLENYPELAQRIRSHLEETKIQAERLELCLEQLGGDASTLKDTGGKLMAIAQSFSGFFAGDEVLKGSLASFAFENMEIASYTILIAAARRLNEEDIVQACEQSLQEEIAMADWLKAHLDATTEQFLERTFVDSDAAKR